jgi:hypothetical protein
VLCYSELSSSYHYSGLSSLQYTHPPTNFNSPIPLSTLSTSFPLQTKPSLTIPPHTISHQTPGPADIHFSKPSSIRSNHRYHQPPSTLTPLLTNGIPPILFLYPSPTQHLEDQKKKAKTHANIILNTLFEPRKKQNKTLTYAYLLTQIPIPLLLTYGTP